MCKPRTTEGEWTKRGWYSTMLTSSPLYNTQYTNFSARLKIPTRFTNHKLPPPATIWICRTEQGVEEAEYWL